MIPRTTAWLMPGILIFMGCAVPALVKPTASKEQTATGERGGETAEATGRKSPEELSPEELSPMVRDEAALIRQTAVKAGYSQAEARQMQQSVINARPEDRGFLTRLIHAHLHRHQDTGAKTDALASSDSAVSAAVSPESSGPSPKNAHRVVQSTSRPPGSETSRRGTHPNQSEADSSEADRTATSGTSPPSSSPKKAAQLPRTTGSTKSAESAESAESADSGQAASAAGESSTKRRQHGEEPPRTSNMETEDKDKTSVRVASAGGGGTMKSGEADDSRSNGLSDSPESGEPISWQEPLDRTIAHLRRELAEGEPLEALDETRLRASLGLLHLVAENPEKAMVTLEGLDEQELEFWRQTMMGLDVLMDADGWPKMRYRVEAASDHLQRGLCALKTLGPLQVNNLAFVSDVRSFGVYDEIGARGFDPGEHVILYVEIGNFTVEETTREEADPTSSSQDWEESSQDWEDDPRVPMYEAALVGRYDILDQDQRIVMSRTLPVIRDRCRHHRRDFFVAYEFHMPREIDSGYYRLELTIEDRKGSKFGSGAIEFRIR
ncbi:MAG: hypothetical protein ACQESR_16595 [Planctomycetota bacterium]